MSLLLAARKNRILPILLAALALPMIICMEAPFEIYGSNLDEFLFSLSDFLPYCLMFWLAGTLGFIALFIRLWSQPHFCSFCREPISTWG